MTDTLWSDISEWNPVVNDQYPYQFLMIRSNDGTYLDKHFQANLDWVQSALQRQKLWGFGVYYFYRPGVNGAQVLMQRLGHPDPHMCVMIDVEGAGGQVSGDNSAPINAQYQQLSQWLGNPARVIGYGNTSDLNSLWPTKPPGLRIVVAAYGSNPDYPGRFAHQFSSSQNTPPFGPSDINSADGMAPPLVQTLLGLVPGAAPPAPSPHPSPIHPIPPPNTSPAWPYPPSDYLGLPSPSPQCHSGHYGGIDSIHVKQWQAQMQHRGWKITPDGDFGQQSDTVARQFQAEKHLVVDGKVGKDTWASAWLAPIT